jgi:hypothetical protein
MPDYFTPFQTISDNFTCQARVLPLNGLTHWVALHSDEPYFIITREGESAGA